MTIEHRSTKKHYMECYRCQTLSLVCASLLFRFYATINTAPVRQPLKQHALIVTKANLKKLQYTFKLLHLINSFKYEVQSERTGFADLALEPVPLFYTFHLFL